VPDLAQSHPTPPTMAAAHHFLLTVANAAFAQQVGHALPGCLVPATSHLPFAPAPWHLPLVSTVTLRNATSSSGTISDSCCKPPGRPCYRRRTSCLAAAPCCGWTAVGPQLDRSWTAVGPQLEATLARWPQFKADAHRRAGLETLQPTMYCW